MSQGNMPDPDRYSVERVEKSENFDVTLQEQLNTGSKNSWQLVGVVQDPNGESVLLVWDTEGMISG
jgi:hypothetical protein